MASIKNLTMSQVTACLRLEAALMATDEARSKEVYAAKPFKNKKKNFNRLTDDQCRVDPNGRHTNDECFQQKNKTAASAWNSLDISDAEIVRRYEASISPVQAKPDHCSDSTKTAAAASKTDTQDEDYVTYSAYAMSTSIGQDNLNQFLLDTGENTHLPHDETLLHDIETIHPVYINGIAGTTGKVMARKSGSATISCTDLSGVPRTLEIKDVLLVPEAGVSLIAVSLVSKNGGLFSGDNCHIKLVNAKQDYVIQGIGANGLYKGKAARVPSFSATPASVPADVWHL